MKFAHVFSIRFIIGVFLFCSITAIAGPDRNAYAIDSKPLEIALLPILDAFPFYVAEASDYFRKEGVRVRALPVGSGLERDQLMQSGEIDGMLNEIMSTANFNRDTIQVKIVMAARKAYPNYPLFRILSAPQSGIDTPAKLTGQPIGIAQNTIIEYITDRLLAREGLLQTEVVKQSIPVIPERYQLLMQGRIKAATLPDPLAKSAMVAGAGLVVDDAKFPQYSMSLLTFSQHSITQRPEAIRRFLKAWDRAVADINTAPDDHRDLLLEKIRVPKNVQHHFKIPPYPRKEVPNRTQWKDVMAWMLAKGLLTRPLPYEDSVTTSFLP
jgi:NitT/TauT family transport system substrate-binding protein